MHVLKEILDGFTDLLYPPECPGCAMHECPVRAAPFEARKRFEVSTATRPDFPLAASTTEAET